MKNTTIQVIVISLFIFSSRAQSNYDFSQLNRAIMRELSGEVIQDLIGNDPQRLEKLKFYFNQSFQVEDYTCQECIVDYKDLLNISLFNVYDFESELLDNEVYTFIFNDKYSISLISKNDLSNHIGTITPFELIHGLPERAFPTWNSVNYGQIDFDSYKAELLLWSTDFPTLYLAKKRSPNVLKTRFVQFSEMTNAEKNAVLTFPGGYIIVDEDIMTYPL